jgi:hypothetical protein
VIENFVVPLGAGWTAGYVAARWGGQNNPVIVGLIAGAGVIIYQKMLMQEVDKQINSYKKDF